MARTLVSIAGPQNSGKTSAVEHLRDNYDFEPFSPPLIIRKFAEDNGINLRQRSDYADVRNLMTEKLGPNWLTKKINERSSSRIALDGLSTVGDFYSLSQLGNFVIAMVCLPPEVGYGRAKARKDPSKDNITYDQYLEELKEESYNVDPLMVSRQEVVDLTPLSHHIDASQPIEAVQAAIGELVIPLLNRS